MHQTTNSCFHAHLHIRRYDYLGSVDMSLAKRWPIEVARPTSHRHCHALCTSMTLVRQAQDHHLATECRREPCLEAGMVTTVRI